MNDNSHLLPGDEHWLTDKALLADLSELNTAIARYVLRQLDVDAGQAKPVSITDEQEFGRKLSELGERVQGRAERRRAEGGDQVIEGEAAQPQALEPGHEPGMDNGP